MTTEQAPRELTDAALEKLWEATFSTRNPFCPCDLSTFKKAVRAGVAADRALVASQAQPAAEPTDAVLAGMQEKFAAFEAGGGPQRGIQEIRDRHRLQWLHGHGSNNVDGYEWGIYRVKWVNGKAAEVWQTNSDFSDLDAAMGEVTAPLSPQENSMTEQAEAWASELATNVAAQCWCDPSCSGIEMDTRLAAVFATNLKAWLLDLARENRNTAFYQGIVTQIGEMFGDAAKTCNDGSMSQSVLALKVPELVQAAMTERGNNLSWAVDRWIEEVKNRPLVNAHRRSLDDSWRQVIRRFGGDPVALVGPAHDELLAAAGL